jgi:hypothetical protein
MQPLWDEDENVTVVSIEDFVNTLPLAYDMDTGYFIWKLGSYPKNLNGDYERWNQTNPPKY